MSPKVSQSILVSLVFVAAGIPVLAQNSTKRNDRPPAVASPTPQLVEAGQKNIDASRYTYEFKQPQFNINHITIEHDALGKGQITFERRSEETPIVEPIQLSAAALKRIFGLWIGLRFLDSDENYQASKNFAHLGTHWLGMNDGTRHRVAEFNWSNNKEAWSLVTEYRRVADQAILIFNLKLARDMQPLNAPTLLNEMESLLKSDGLSDPRQLVPLLTELRTDEHIPLIARNQADRILKKIEK